MTRAPAATALLVALTTAGCPRAGPATPPAAPDGPRPRVVTAAPALAEMVCALGGRAHLVGVSRYCVFPPELRDLPRIGGAIDPNLEAIEGLAPDLILLQNRSQLLLDLAARRPFEVIEFELETLADVRGGFTRLAGLLDRPEAGDAQVARLDAALEAARGAAPAARPRTLLVFGHQPGELGSLSTFGAATFVSECLQAAGGDSCVADLAERGYPLISTELVLERAPELIVELVPEPVTQAQAEALRADWRRLSSVPAVRDGRIAVVSGSEVLLPGPRLDRLLAKLSRAVAGETLVADPPGGS